MYGIVEVVAGGIVFSLLMSPVAALLPDFISVKEDTMIMNISPNR